MSIIEPKIAPKTTFTHRLRRYFFTGIVIIAPAAITIWATVWFIQTIDGIVKPLLSSYINPDNYLPFHLPGFGLVVALVAITLIGFLAANFVGRTLLSLWDKLLNHTPVVRSLYSSSKQIFETLFSDSGASFRQVCLVEWPRKGLWSVCFVSRELDSGDIGLKPGTKMYSVYTSTTPNPTSGYVFFVKATEIKILDMKVEDGLKLVISMGLVFPEKPLPEAQEKKVGRKISRKTKA
ncbi:MAG: DUF502 domain-containing protein [Aestuariivirga sp.]